MKTKTYDCVAMKRASQAALREEYVRRKSEFSSYSDFINAAVHEHAWTHQFVQRAANHRKAQ